MAQLLRLICAAAGLADSSRRETALKGSVYTPGAEKLQAEIFFIN
jgi:hypothetical protein